MSVRVQIPSLASLSELGSGIAASCSIGHRHNLDPALLCLWHRLAAAALIQPLAWELPYVTDAAVKKKTTKKLSHSASLCLSSALLLPFKDLCNYNRSTQITQDNPFVLRT